MTSRQAGGAGALLDSCPFGDQEIRELANSALADPMAWVRRCAFTALPVERLHEPITDELAELVAARVRLTRYLADLGLALPQDTT